jgi:hypothetical protein
LDTSGNRNNPASICANNEVVAMILVSVMASFLITGNFV